MGCYISLKRIQNALREAEAKNAKMVHIHTEYGTNGEEVTISWKENNREHSYILKYDEKLNELNLYTLKSTQAM